MTETEVDFDAKKVLELVKENGISSLFNFREQVLPAVSYCQKIHFSPSNFTEEPLPFFPKDHYRNKNRRHWSFQEREDLIASVFGSACTHPAGTKLYIEHIAEVPHLNGLYQVSDGIEQEWNMGRIIAMGENTWDFLKYPMGSRATLNDYVIYNQVGTVKMTLRHGVVIIMCEDWHVWSTVEDPQKLLEA